MSNNNAQKKKQIDDAVAKYNARMSVLKQKRDKIISDFSKVLNEKKIAELRKQLGII